MNKNNVMVAGMYCELDEYHELHVAFDLATERFSTAVMLQDAIIKLHTYRLLEIMANKAYIEKNDDGDFLMTSTGAWKI